LLWRSSALFVLGLFTGGRILFIQALLKFAIPLLALAALIVRSLWVRIPAPEGISIREDQAPNLFEAADRLSQQLRAPRPRDVILDGRFNAGVAQIPRFGVLGWSRNYLPSGSPLLDALTPEQFEAVLAHEFGTSPERIVASGRGSIASARAGRSYART
jgi:Zn-dependent protease with chaperone function